MVRRDATRYEIWLLSALSLGAAALFPAPWCVDCETATPFGHIYSGFDDVGLICVWAAPLLAGFMRMRAGWLVPLFTVASQEISQMAAGENWADFSGNEGPIILVIGLPTAFFLLLAGYMCSLFYEIAARGVWRKDFL